MLEVEEDRWLTYAEAGRLLRISPSAARMHAKRRGWARRSPNAIGARAMVLVPPDAAVQHRIDELQAAVTEERRRLIMLLTDGRPWWRRWFR